MAKLPVDATAFTVFDMHELDAGLALAGDELAAVFFWGSNRFNYEVATKAMLAQPEALRAPGLRWFHRNVCEHCGLGWRFMLHGGPAWFFFCAAKVSAGRLAGAASGSSKPRSPRFAGRFGHSIRALRPVVRRAAARKQ
ncbi:thioredoxin [Paraburkholderia bryophila]|uniref:Uncharacterized protein n=1 Tax=Paraburkholderia bryophila TaxID=420952 RepID=A0A329BV41_9BURK|nr:hypothetical protein BX591_12280 [Paraburkholderia bryophila]